MSTEAFEKLARGLLAAPGLTTGRMFGSEGLKINGKVFAMNVKGDFVVKLPAGRCSSLVEQGHARPFDPGHGRLMKEWVALKPADEEECAAYVTEARRFVTG